MTAGDDGGRARRVGGQGFRRLRCRLRRPDVCARLVTARRTLTLSHRLTARAQPQGASPPPLSGAPRPHSAIGSGRRGQPAARVQRAAARQRPPATGVRAPPRHRRRTSPPPARATPGSIAARGSGGRRRIDSARHDCRRRRACLGQRHPPAPNRRSRPARCGTSCEVPHAPERPADIRDTAGASRRPVFLSRRPRSARWPRASPPGGHGRDAAASARFPPHTQSPPRPRA